jgi:citrate lyase subunit beta/citryl-CoA lyase
LNAGAARPSPRPLRSLLFVPGHRRRWIESAVASGTDAILFDLQDAVPEEQVAAAREVVRSAVDASDGTGPGILVRVAPVGSPAFDEDLDAVVAPGLSGIVVPMLSAPSEVEEVAARLDRLEVTRGIPAGSTVIFPLVETAPAARFSYEIASASARVAYMGGATTPDGDIARALGFRWTAEGNETLFLRSWVLLNVKAAGVMYPISGLWPLLDDLDGLRAFAEQTRDLGYSGMMAIHPSHVPVINEVFTPSAADIRRWHETIDALDAARAAGTGAVRMGATMVDAAHVRTAELGLELARRLGVVDWLP